MVVVAGQSRGAWNSLQVLDTPGLADAVIAVSPASFSNQGTQEVNLFRILHGIRASAARVAVAQFKGDVYVRGMPERIDMLRTQLSPRVAAVLVIDQPGPSPGTAAAIRLTSPGGLAVACCSLSLHPWRRRIALRPQPPDQAAERFRRLSVRN